MDSIVCTALYIINTNIAVIKKINGNHIDILSLLNAESSLKVN